MIEHAMSTTSEDRSIEWPTLLLVFAVHATWFASVWWFRRLPLVVAIAALGFATAWHSSLQHELIHGHPFAQRAINHGLGSLPLGLWMPFEAYRVSHLRHHRDQFLTDVREDPESWYTAQTTWLDSTVGFRMLLWFNRTLVGRLLVGPWLAIFGFYRQTLHDLVKGERTALRGWTSHVPLTALVVAFSVKLCHVPAWALCVGTLQVGTSTILFRSFAEHRWTQSGTRSAVVRAGLPWSLLYLNNNLHAAHHCEPHVAWYRLPDLAAILGAETMAAEGAGWYRSYFHVIRKFAFRPFCQPLHPEEGSLEPWSTRGMP